MIEARAKLPDNRDSDESELVGAIHVHSRYSDGTGAVPEIIAAAKKAQADFVLLTDHDTLAPRREGWEGWHDGVLLIVGVEITPRRRGHCLALGVRNCCGCAIMETREFLDHIHAQGGMAMVAHPRGERKREFRINQVAWRDWDHPAVAGLEIWSYMHDWIADLRIWRFHQYHAYLKRPHTKITGPHPRVLRLWDRLGQHRHLAGISGLDCHAREVPLTDLKLFPYEEMFKTVRTHLFVPSLSGKAEDTERVLAALAAGRGFISYDFISDARGTRAWAECSCGEVIPLGGEHPAHAQIALHISSPQKAQLRLLKDGTSQAETESFSLEHHVAEPGVYRFEARLEGQPWIFTNPFYIRQPETSSPKISTTRNPDEQPH